jgi:protocatechuate 3,4-dioxygenase, alpha subunit
MKSQGLTPSQTIGPFFEPALLRDDSRRNVLVGPNTAGERVRVEGQVLDGEAGPVPDALIELWQANSHGRYHHPTDRRDLPLDPDFTGFGRTGTDEEGRFWFETIKPGPVPAAGGGRQAPHLNLTIFARGLLDHLLTRLYFEDEPANLDDPVLGLVPPERRATLVATRAADPGGTTYRLNIVLQGAGETAFFRY